MRTSRLRTAALTLAIAAATGVIATASAAATPPRTQLIAGVGHFTLDDVNVVGHRIRFAVHARTAPDGTARGSFRFRHLLPDGKLLSIGHADVTCLQVSGDTALLTAHVTREYIPPAPPGLPIGPHAFYVKIIDGGADDQIVFSQANDPPPGTTLPRECIDVEARWPGLLKRYPIERGGYVLHRPRTPAS